MDRTQLRMFKQALNEFGICSFIAGGKSMAPFIKAGVQIVISKTSDFHFGDCIAFYLNNQLILHRAVRIYKSKDGKIEFIKTAGDSSPKSICTVHISKILGKAICINDNGRRHSKWIAPPLSIIAVFLAPILRSYFCLVIKFKRMFNTYLNYDCKKEVHQSR